MSAYLEAGLFRQPPLQPGEVAGCEIDDPAAVGANQVMVVLGRPPHEIAAAVTAGVHFADEPEPGQHFQRAVYRHQADAGVPAPYLFVDGCRGKMLVALHDGIDHRPALRGNLMTVLP